MPRDASRRASQDLCLQPLAHERTGDAWAVLVGPSCTQFIFESFESAIKFHDHVQVQLELMDRLARFGGPKHGRSRLAAGSRRRAAAAACAAAAAAAAADGAAALPGACAAARSRGTPSDDDESDACSSSGHFCASGRSP